MTAVKGKKVRKKTAGDVFSYYEKAVKAVHADNYKQANKLLDEIAKKFSTEKDVLAKEGAELVATNDMGMRKLAYPVEKHARGYYTVLFYKGEGTVIQELERNLKISEDVIKFLTVKYVKNKELTQFNKLVESANKKAAAAAETPAVETPAVETPAVETPAAETTEA